MYSAEYGLHFLQQYMNGLALTPRFLRTFSDEVVDDFLGHGGTILDLLFNYLAPTSHRMGDGVARSCAKNDLCQPPTQRKRHHSNADMLSYYLYYQYCIVILIIVVLSLGLYFILSFSQTCCLTVAGLLLRHSI